MLRTNQLDIEQRPRKKVKLDTVNTDEYNEFKGDAVEEIESATTVNHFIQHQQINLNDEIKYYSQIYQTVVSNPRANRKILPKGSQQQEKTNIKMENNIKIEQDKEKSKSKKEQQKMQVKKKNNDIPSSNWKQFLAKQTSNKKKHYEFISIDCQFVKSDQQQCLARVSLVNEHGQEVYDSYVKPNKKITDFVTQISGITFSHIKNAPPQQKVIAQLKKKMLNKIIVGHTTEKDLEVCQLKNWTGFKKIIDIAEAQAYSPGGKRVALKKLAMLHLGKTIQQGWHSSIEDANTTMQLFLKHKNDILKQKKIVKV